MPGSVNIIHCICLAFSICSSIPVFCPRRRALTSRGGTIAGHAQRVEICRWKFCVRHCGHLRCFNVTFCKYLVRNHLSSKKLQLVLTKIKFPGVLTWVFFFNDRTVMIAVSVSQKGDFILLIISQSLCSLNMIMSWKRLTPAVESWDYLQPRSALLLKYDNRL